ncbi:MAG: ABC transporter substrate-binding protein, partial [Thermoplasmata archaeon]
MGGTIRRKAFVSAVSLFVVFALVFSTFPAFVAGDNTRQGDEAILRIGSQDEPKTRNILASGDVWTMNVLGPVYDSVTQLDAETEELKAYILKGTDLNGNGQFDSDEYEQFGPIEGKPKEVTAFYDFNGVRFHDGYQATVEDLLFTYHMFANDPRSISLDVLKDKNNIGGNYTISKWLWLYELKGFDEVQDWKAEKPYSNYNDPGYDTSLRAALHFVQQVPYANFYRYTMSESMLPRYRWEGTGCIYNKDEEKFTCGIHKKEGQILDFGYAFDPDTGNGNPGTPDLKEFDFDSAESWDLPDESVIGTGPFLFDTWEKGAFSSLSRNDDFYEGEPYIHKPYIDRMLFKVYRTTQTAVFALKSGDIDYIAWSIQPDFVPELLNDPNIGITST